MNPVIVKFERLPHLEGIELPSYATEASSGMDLRSTEDVDIPVMERRLIPCGFKMALPEGYEAQVRPRSGLAAKFGVTVLNTPGTIDADYRGEVKVILINLGKEPFVIQKGDRIAQMVVAPYTQVAPEIVRQVDSTVRGEGGFGHTGKG